MSSALLRRLVPKRGFTGPVRSPPGGQQCPLAGAQRILLRTGRAFVTARGISRPAGRPTVLYSFLARQATVKAAPHRPADKKTRQALLKVCPKKRTVPFCPKAASAASPGKPPALRRSCALSPLLSGGFPALCFFRYTQSSARRDPVYPFRRFFRRRQRRASPVSGRLRAAPAWVQTTGAKPRISPGGDAPPGKPAAYACVSPFSSASRMARICSSR